MKRFGRVLSWAVIEKEIVRVAEERGEQVRARRTPANAPLQPRVFVPEEGTVWQFQRRGAWAVHSGDYRGNWPPGLVRNLILRFTKRGDVIIDPMVGGGTTVVEAVLLGRACYASDISPHAITITRTRLRSLRSKIRKDQPSMKLSDVHIWRGDARNIERVPSNTANLVCVHPPYWNLLKYTHAVANDLSRINDYSQFLNEMRKVASEAYRITKRRGVCAVLIGDVRNHNRFEPLGFHVFSLFREAGFGPESIVVKTQHNDRSTAFYVQGKAKHLLFQHEYLQIFRKP